MVKKIKDKKNLPFVSVCTPTFNRRPFWPVIIKCFNNQDYPMDKLEWIIIDDGTDKIEDLVIEIPQVKYFKYEEKMPIGEKRNIMNEKTSGDIIVYMDDDDYYPPVRVTHAVNMLLTHPSSLCAGTSEINFLDINTHKIFKFGPYGPNHGTAATFAFRKEMLKEYKYDNKISLLEERDFLKNYTVRFIQLEPKKTILGMFHGQNTYYTGINRDDPYVVESDKTIDYFIKEEEIKDFFENKLLDLLKDYEEGDIKYKPDVLEQINKKNKKFVAKQDGKTIELDNDTIMKIIEKQKKDNSILQDLLNEKIKEIDRLKLTLTVLTEEKDKEIEELKCKTKDENFVYITTNED